MSSACVCHTDEYCFYCEMYVPLEEKHKRQTNLIRTLAREIELQIKKAARNGIEEKSLLAKPQLLGRCEAFDFVLRELRMVIDKHENRDTWDSTKPKRNDKRIQAK